MSEVVAGVSLALCGPLRVQGEQALDGLRLWVAWVTDQGGLPVGPGVRHASSSSPTAGAST